MRICIVQKKNVFLNTQASLQILQENLTEALSKGARIIVFPETWLPGYPVWIDAAARAGLWREKGRCSFIGFFASRRLRLMIRFGAPCNNKLTNRKRCYFWESMNSWEIP